MPIGADRVAEHSAPGAVPYDRPEGAIPMTIMPVGSVPYISDTPYTPPTLPYAQRPTCIGTRRNGQPCKAKAEDASPFCKAHPFEE